MSCRARTDGHVFSCSAATPPRGQTTRYFRSWRLRRRAARGSGTGPVERRDREAPGRRRTPGPAGRGHRRRGGRRHLGAGVVRGPVRGQGPGRIRTGRRRRVRGRGDPGRDEPLRAGGRGVRTGHPGRPARHGGSHRVRRAHHRGRGPGAGPIRGRRGPQRGGGGGPRGGRNGAARAPFPRTLQLVLKVVLPKGSLEKATLALFEAADLTVHRSSTVEYNASVDDPRIDEVRILRPQEIASYVADGLFDLGITGGDWVEETAADVVTLGELRYSKATSRPIRLVVAVPHDSPVERVDDLPQGVKVSTEYPELTRRYFQKRGIDADIRLSYGATEAKVPDIVDCIVEITETGRALRAAGLKIVDEILQSYTELVANPAAYADDAKRRAMEQVRTLLHGALEARGKVLVKLNVGRADLDEGIRLVPSMKAPTVSELFGEGGYAVETVVLKSEINTLIPALKEAGASDIIELPLAKIVHLPTAPV